MLSALSKPDSLPERIKRLLADPAQADNPLRAELAELLAYSQAQDERMERLLRIADGYYEVARRDSHSLVERYERQVRRLEKLARISDRYQRDLREMAESLKEAALTDPLTGLGNRRYLMERVEEEMARAERTGTIFSLALMDVDNFKAINDRFGHETGDRVLCQLTSAITGALRESDICGRWGGEEFLIVLAGTSLAGAGAVIERLRASIAATDVPALEGEGSITASFGLTEHRAPEVLSRLLHRADTALYRAKALGRNRVELA